MAKHTLEQLVECLIQVIGRAAMSEARVREIVGTGTKQIKAYNLADGTRTQKEISHSTGIAPGNLSTTFQRWIENGVVFSIGEGKDARMLHIFPIGSSGGAKSTGGKSGKGRT